MSNVSDTLISLCLPVILFFSITYAIAIIKKDFGVIDTAWGLSFMFIFSLGWAGRLEAMDFRSTILGAFVFMWGTRLSAYLHLRNQKNGQEDFRYRQWRIEWGSKANVNFFFRVYMLQACLSLAIGYPLYLVHSSYPSQPLNGPLDGLGSLLFVLGFLMEAIADHQKNNFKSDPKNKDNILQSGLWSWCRHPNYFGEALLWWGFFLICCSSTTWYLIICSPLLINFLLIKVSGVPMLEKKYEGRTDYEAYKKNTSAFVPFLNRLKL